MTTAASDLDTILDGDFTVVLAQVTPMRVLGWVGGDGYPVVVPVRAIESEGGILALSAPTGLVPEGGRRAGLTGHAFTTGTLGQRQLIMTGWLESDGATARYAPHARIGYTVPHSRLAWRVIVAGVTRIGLERARRDGVPSLPPRDIRHRLAAPFQRHIANPIGRRLAPHLNSQAVLETIGRTSGQPRHTPIGGRREGSSYWFVSEFGRNAQYVKNIIANPKVRIQIRGAWHSGIAILLDDDNPRERLRHLPRLNSAAVRAVGSNLLTIRIDLD